MELPEKIIFRKEDKILNTRTFLFKLELRSALKIFTFLVKLLLYKPNVWPKTNGIKMI